MLRGEEAFEYDLSILDEVSAHALLSGKHFFVNTGSELFPCLNMT